MSKTNRRNLIKGMALTLGGALSPACQQALNVKPAERRISELPYDGYLQQIAHVSADLIIPETDTPGALQAGVGEFIDYVVASWYRAEERQRFIDGLNLLELQAQEKFSQPYVQLSNTQQTELLQQAEVRVKDVGSNFGSGDFFAQLKELTVVGYFTSEIGATQELNYVPMPGSYDGYHKFVPGDRQWSS